MGVDELAIVLDRSERAIRDDIRRGRIAHLRLGGAIKVRRADLEKSLQSLVRNPA
jgi:excisionase family DNA binding protein